MPKTSSSKIFKDIALDDLKENVLLFLPEYCRIYKEIPLYHDLCSAYLEYLIALGDEIDIPERKQMFDYYVSLMRDLMNKSKEHEEYRKELTIRDKNNKYTKLYKEYFNYILD